MVGSFMAEYLLKNTDWQIYGLLRWRSDTRNNENIIEEINKRKRVFLVYGDLNDETVENIFKNRFDYIFHLAAHGFRKRVYIAYETLNTNIIGHVNYLGS